MKQAESEDKRSIKKGEIKMDLKKMTKKELCDLRNKLNEEIGLRELHCKSDLSVVTEVQKIFEGDLKDNGLLKENHPYYLEQIEKSIFKICDFTLKNYHVKGQKMSIGNGYILDRFDDYKNMTTDILTIIDKYHA